MKLRGFLGASASALLLSSAASAAVLDTFSVQANDPVGVNSSVNFVLGAEYTIDVSGVWCCSFNRSIDAEWNSGVPTVSAGGGFDWGLWIDGMDVDWGPYNDARQYSFVTSALSGTVNFRINDPDGNYTANTGFLSVIINGETPQDPGPTGMPAVPLPAGMPLLLAGLGGLAWMRRRKI